MSLIDEIMSEPGSKEPEYQPRTEFDGATGYIQTGPLVQRPADESLLKEFGYSPDEVTIVGNPHVSRWQQRSAVRQYDGEKDKYIRTGEYETVWLQAYKFTIVPKMDSAAPDIAELVSKFKKTPAKPPTTPNPYWFVFQAGDQQLGKKSRDGSTEEIIERYLESVERAREEFKGLKRFGIEGIQLSFPGDCIEGNQSQSGRNMWLTQETITEQVKIFRRLLYHTVEQLSPLASQCIVTVVNGNHDQAQRDPVNFYPGDGWATHCAEAVAERLEDKPDSFGHVEVVIPNKWRGAVAVEVGDTIVTVVHGHQWPRGKGMDWLSKQAVNRHPTGAAQVVQHGHWHEMKLESNREVMIIGSPTFEVASDYLIEKQGSTAKRGALVYLMRSGEANRITLV